MYNDYDICIRNGSEIRSVRVIGAYLQRERKRLEQENPGADISVSLIQNSSDASFYKMFDKGMV